MEYETLVEMVAAAHLSQFVDSAFKQRGGLFLVGPPGSFKSTVQNVLDHFPHTLYLSDVNVQSIIKMKPHLISGETRTIAFADFAKLYKRHKATASSLEGILMALAEEGFRRASFEPQTPTVTPAHAVIIGGMTTAFYDEKIHEWEGSGFARRFVWARYVVKNIEIIEEAQFQNRMARLNGHFLPKVPTSHFIPYMLGPVEVTHLKHISRHIMYKSGGCIVMLEKLYCALIWKFGKARAKNILDDFAPCLMGDGGVLELKEVR